MTDTFHLAQFNQAKGRFEQTDPRFQSFIDLLTPVHTVADQAKGFVWRMEDEEGEAGNSPGGITPEHDPKLLLNLTLWEDIDSLKFFTFNTVHKKVMSRKAEWFELMESHNYVLWWVKAGHVPDIDEAFERIAMIDKNGPAPDAFNFKNLYDYKGKAVEQTTLEIS